MMLEPLIPGVQDAEESYFGTKMLRVAGDLAERFGTGPEQKGTDLAFILHRQWRKLPRQSEDDVNVARGQQFPFPRSEPTVAGIPLALWTVPVTAGVERDDLMSASGTCIHMCAERGGSAEQNGVQHFEMQPGEPLPALLVKALAGCADHIGHLYR